VQSVAPDRIAQITPDFKALGTEQNELRASVNKLANKVKQTQRTTARFFFEKFRHPAKILSLALAPSHKTPDVGCGTRILGSWLNKTSRKNKSVSGMLLFLDQKQDVRDIYDLELTGSRSANKSRISGQRQRSRF